MSVAIITEALLAHRNCWHGLCTDGRGTPCGWKAKRSSRAGHPNMGEQHLNHVAEAIHTALEMAVA